MDKDAESGAKSASAEVDQESEVNSKPGSGWTRRRFLALGIGGGFALYAPIRFGFYEEAEHFSALKSLSLTQGAVLAALVDAILPARADRTPERLREHVRAVDAYLQGMNPVDVRDLGLGLLGIEHATLPFGPYLRRFTRLPRGDRQAYLRGWQRSRFGLRRLGFRGIVGLVFIAYYRSPESFRAIGYSGPVVPGYEGPEESRARYDRLLAPPGAHPSLNPASRVAGEEESGS